MDASPDPASLKGGWRIEGGGGGGGEGRKTISRPIEPGFKGFWVQYQNIYKLVKELGIAESEVFTPLTRSGFYTPNGLFAEAPIFTDLPRLPAPLGQAIYTLPLFRGIPIQDRASLSGLLVEMVRYKASPELYLKYDRMTAKQLFDQLGFSKFLVDKFVCPILLVSLFAPPEELSAAVVMDMLYYYAMGHQSDVDVRWARKPISEALIRPMVAKIQNEATRANITANVNGNSYVKEILIDDDEKNNDNYTAKGVVVVDKDSGKERFVEADAVCLAVGVTGLQNILRGSPSLSQISPDLRKSSDLRAIDVISTRIWLDKRVMCPFPSSILADFPELEGSGATFFCLDVLHDDPWGEYNNSQHSSKDSLNNNDGNKDNVQCCCHQRGSVIAADFYHASQLSTLPDEEIIRRLKEVLLPASVPDFANANIIDSWVMRFPKAVTHFSPGSAVLRPPQEIPQVNNLVVAGDLVRDLDHGSAGLSQERAYVSGLNAGNILIRRRSIADPTLANDVIHPILSTEEDEPQFKLARDTVSTLERIRQTLFLPLS